MFRPCRRIESRNGSSLRLYLRLAHARGSPSLPSLQNVARWVVEVFDLAGGDVWEAALWLSFTSPAYLAVFGDWRAFCRGMDEIGEEDAGAELRVGLIERA